MKLHAPICIAFLAAPALAQDPCGDWSAIPTPNPAGATVTVLAEIDPISPNDVWAVGRKTIPFGSSSETQTVSMHWNGSAWSLVPTPSPSPAPGGGWSELLTVKAVGPNDVWAAGSQRIQAPDGFVGTHIMVQRWNGSQWSVLNTPVTIGGSGNFVDDLEVIAADDIWFVGDWLEFPPANVAEKRALAMHWDGSQFTIHDTPFFNNENIGGHGLTAVSAVSRNDVWAVGGGHDGDYVDFSYIVHWDGSQWSYVPGPTAGFFHRLYDVHAVSASEVYAVGDYQDASGYHGMFLRWDGSSWTRLPDPPVGGSSIEVLGPTQIYVGGNGVALWDGASWTTVASFPGVSSPSVQSLEPNGPCSVWGSGRAFSGNVIVAQTFRLDATPPGANYCVATPNSVGPGAVIGAAGSASLSANDLALLATGCPPKKVGLFFHGTANAQIPFGNGFRCVGGVVKRRPALQSSANGSVWQPFDAVGSGILPGQARYFQFWYRDAVGAGFNLTNGMAILFAP